MDVPSVPITTLAGVASLTDLLPEMPLPTPLPQTLSNKSLLFHPRVAEEAQNYLRAQDDLLVPQLLQSLSQTSADHIDVKDNFMCTEASVDPHGDIPPLLQSLITANPNVFRGKGDHQSNNMLDPYANYQNKPHVGGGGGALNCKPAQDANLHQYHDPAMSMATSLPMENSLDMHTALSGRMDIPNNTSVTHAMPLQQQQQDVMFTDHLQQQQQQQMHQQQQQQHLQPPMNQHAHHSQLDYDNYAQNSTSNVNTTQYSQPQVPPELNEHLPQIQSLPQPPVQVQLEQQPQQTQTIYPPTPALPPPPTMQNHSSEPPTNDCSAAPVIKQPIVRLQRISDKDQLLMQKSLTHFIENRPKLAKELGIEGMSEPEKKSEKTEKTSEKTDKPTEKTSEKSEKPEKTEKNRSGRSKAEKSKEQPASDDDDDDETLDQLKKKKKPVKTIVEEAEEADDYVPDTFTALVGKKRRFEPAVERPPEPVIKPKLRKVEKKVGPVVHKMTQDELMESNTYGRFMKNVDYVLKFYSNLDFTEIGDDGMVPDEHLLSRHIVQELATEAAKLNILSAMDMIPTEKIVKLLNLLEITIRGADRVTPITDEDNDNMRQLWIETAMERVMGAADACLSCLHILTARNMPKRVYIEDVIDRIVLYIKYQLVNTIFPSYDVTYRIDSKKKADGRKRKSIQALDRNVQVLYNKLCELVSKLADLMEIQLLTDTIVLHTSSMGVAPFFTENVSELQLSSLKLVTTLFTRYEKHRRLLLDDILASIARLPSSKRSLRTYKLNSDECIQMLTALVLQLIQCIVVLPENLNKRKKDRDKEEKKDRDGEKLKNVDKDVLISNKNREAMSTAGTFLSAFLSKCGTKNEDIDYRPLFENFVQDLLTTVNKPEWPATEMVLSLLGKLLVTNFSNKGIDMSLRVASLDYLGVVAARLRRDSVLSRCKLSTIDHMIKEIKAVELRETEGEVSKEKLEIKNDEERIQFLQRALLDFLAVKAQNDEPCKFARHFYIVEWYKECNSEKAAIKEPKNNTKPNAKDNHRNRKRIDDSDNSDDEVLSNHKEKEKDIEALIEQQRTLDERKKFLLSKICAFKETVSAGNKIKVFETYIDYDMAELIAQYLASKRHFSKCFDIYLKSILFVLREPSIAIRTKAMKCLTMIVEADPSVLGTRDVQIGVNFSIVDHSTSVREAAVDLVGKFVLSRPELINKYYQVLLDRILDTGVSVRKRVIKILKDICIECPEFPKIPEICVKMIRRVNDEEGIRKLVMEVFQNMWFTAASKESLRRKVMNITDVVASSNDSLEWFEQLLVSLFKPKEDKDDSTRVNTEPPKAMLHACKQIVDCLIENILRIEESSNGTSQRLIACITTLYLFAKIRPQLLVKHASTLQPYLSVKSDSRTETEAIIERVAKMLELVVPMMEHPSDSFLSQLEEDLMKLILQHDRNIVSSCVSCLAAIVNRVTRNYKLIRDCFTKFFQYLERFYEMQRNQEQEPHYRHTLVHNRGNIRRSLFTVGLLFRYFDFKDPEVSDSLMNTKDKIYEMFMYFLRSDDADIQAFTLIAMGSICIRHYEFLLEEELKEYYHRMLLSSDVPVRNRVEVLRNIESYLVEAEQLMIHQDLEWAKRCKDENLKEMGDVSSGMASAIIQLYLKEVLKSYQHAEPTVRQPALKVIQLVLQQGLVHPMQIIPYLICMSTDPIACISSVADKQLSEIDKKYPGFIYTPSLFGIRLSYELQCIITPSALLIRGTRVKNKDEYPSALNGYLYTLLRSSKQQRRALVLSILRQFDQTCTSLSYMLYLADNLAYFPYQVQDELLFLVHQINVILAASGANLLQTFREGLIMTEAQKMAMEAQQRGEQINAVLDDEDEDEESLIARVPEDVGVLQDCLKSAQGSLLLLVLKQHIKDTFGLSDGKIQQYSPSEPVKVHEKVANRKSNALFNPKTTLNKINEGPPPAYLDFEGRKDLIRQYLDFKQLMMQLDPDDDEDDLNTKTPAVNANVTFNNIATSSVLTDADQVVLSNYKDNAPPKVPKLVISNRRMDSEPKQRSPRKSNTDKLRKHRHKKKRRKIVSSGEESDFSDPDYMG